MKNIALTIAVIFLVLGGGYGAWYAFQHQQNVTVIFSNGYGLKPGAGVWMS